MKKALSILLALSLLLCCAPALAEEAAEYTPYTDPTGHYSLEYPADYLLLDAETIDALISAMESGEIDIGFDFSTYGPMLKESNLTLFVDPFTGNNVNVVIMDLGAHLSAEILVQLSIPATREQYKTMMPDAVYDDEGSVKTINGTDFAHLALRYPQNGVSVYMEQYVVCVGSLMYNLTFTYNNSPEEADIAHMVSTFSAAAE